MQVRWRNCQLCDVPITLRTLSMLFPPIPPRPAPQSAPWWWQGLLYQGYIRVIRVISGLLELLGLLPYSVMETWGVNPESSINPVDSIWLHAEFKQSTPVKLQQIQCRSFRRVRGVIRVTRAICSRVWGCHTTKFRFIRVIAMDFCRTLSKLLR